MRHEKLIREIFKRVVEGFAMPRTGLSVWSIVDGTGLCTSAYTNGKLKGPFGLFLETADFSEDFCRLRPISDPLVYDEYVVDSIISFHFKLVEMRS